ncbi:hypothetical protein GCM10008967_12650 [Bacillus carboniphilus]|uniref:Uncharacterized protein n=1 Tax=Bacillus carboniphilus TaxID=86663 RepID=A0ABN0W2S4_9BACI
MFFQRLSTDLVGGLFCIQKKCSKIYADIIEKGERLGEFSTKYNSEIIARSISTFMDGLALDHAILPEEELKLKEQSIFFVEYLKLALEVNV